MTAKEVAAALGVSRGRVFQLVGTGELPGPASSAGRTRLWDRADVRAAVARREGGAVSVSAATLAPVTAPLVRELDRVAEYDLARGFGPGSTLVHLRVWSGPAPEGTRVVVVLGVMRDHVFIHDRAAAEVSKRWLTVPGVAAVWYVVRLDGIDRLTVDNVIYEWRQPSRWPRMAWSRVSAAEVTTSMDLPQFDLSPATFDDLDAVVGETIEHYPASVYTPQTVQRFLDSTPGRITFPGLMTEQTGGEPIDVAYDDMELGPLCDTLARLDPFVGQAGGPRADDAATACHFLADEVRSRLPLRRDQRDIDRWLALGQEGRRGPKRWAARVVPIEPSPAQRALLDRYPGEFTVNDDNLAARTALLNRLWAWADDTGPYADTPDPDTHDAVTYTADTLAHYIHVTLDWTLGDHARRPHRDTEPRAYEVGGPIDRAYLATATTLEGFDPDDSTATPDDPDLRRRARTLRAALHRSAGVTAGPLRYGLDPDHRLVITTDDVTSDVTSDVTAVEPRWENRRGIAWYAVEWPLRAPTKPIPDEVVLLADGQQGDRPVYLGWPDGRLDLLPSRPNGQIMTPWNFGYPGGGPRSLVEDITEVFAAVDSRPRQAMPSDEIDRYVCEPSQRDRLHVPIAHIREHYHDTSNDPTTRA